jgi:hypothetical protein
MENCDYVTRILNAANVPEFSIEKFRKLLEELRSEGIQRVQRAVPQGNAGMNGPTLFGGNGAQGQQAVAVDAVSGMVSSGVQNGPGGNASSPVIPSADINLQKGVQKPKKEKKRGFGSKKKKQEKAGAGLENSGMAIPGMNIPGMAVPGVKGSGMDVPGPAGNVTPAGKMPDEPQGLSDIAAKINIPGNGASSEGMGSGPALANTPEWKVSSEFSKKMGISDGTIMLELSPELPALIRRLRNGETALIEHDELVIGKARTGVDYCIEDNSTISRVHAKIICRNKKYYIIDNHSMNHTFVNDRQIQEGVEVPIKNGDKLRLSDEEFVFSTQQSGA